MEQQPPKEPTPFPSRLESELNEILSKTDRSPSPVIKLSSHARRQRVRAMRRFRGPASLRATGTNLLILTVVLAVASVLVAGSSPLLGKFIAYASFGTLIYLLGRSLFRPHNALRTKRWRGRDIEF